MEKRYVVAYDVGTSGVKIIFFSLDGVVLASAIETYPLYTTENNHAEQDPEAYWKACCRGTKRISADSGFCGTDCAGMAFGTQWKSIIPVDSSGSVLRKGIIWMDKRAGKQAKQLNDAFNEALFCESDYWPKLAWFRESEPDIYDKSAFILEADSYLKWKATGVYASDITNCYTRSYNALKQQFFDEVLRIANLDKDKFPPICQATDLVGHVTEQAAEELGLNAGTPVFGGCCDIPAMAIGSGCCARGDAHAYLGTSGWMGYIAPHDPKVVYVSPLDKENDVSFYGLGASVGASTNWVIDRLYADEKRKFGKGIWQIVEEELKQVQPASDRLLAAPWFYGSRPPFSSGKARGVFLNLNGNHSRAHMLGATFEGFCYIMRQNLELLNSRIREPLKSLTVCGGGANNTFWMQAMANVLKIPVKVPRDAESTGAIGVAYCALIGLGMAESFDTIKKHITIDKVHYPDATAFAEYDFMFAQYEKLYPAFQDMFDIMN